MGDAATEWLHAGAAPLLRGERVLLRGWRVDDLEPFADLNADPRVMEHYPELLTRERSDAMVWERILPQFAERGYGLWALEVPGSAPFIGFVGLQAPAFEASLHAVRRDRLAVGVRLLGTRLRDRSGPAGARFRLRDDRPREIVSFTSPENRRSIAVMERLGMRFDGEFEHPNVPRGHRLRTHVLYRLARPDLEE